MVGNIKESDSLNLDHIEEYVQFDFPDKNNDCTSTIEYMQI